MQKVGDGQTGGVGWVGTGQHRSVNNIYGEIEAVVG